MQDNNYFKIAKISIFFLILRFVKKTDIGIRIFNTKM